MTTRTPLRYLRVLLFCLSLTSFQINAQVFSAEKVSYQSARLENTFTAFEVFKIDAEPLATFVKTGTESATTLTMGEHSWSLNLTTSDLLSPAYFTSIQSSQGNIISHKRPNIAFKGYESSGGNVRLTLDKDFIYGFIQQNGLTWRIEPLRYLEPGADPTLFVVYEKSNIINTPGATCGVTEEMEKLGHLHDDEKYDKSPANPESFAQYELEIAIASDKLMVDDYGGEAGAEAHNIGVLNDVEGDYANQFNHSLCFNIVTQFFATSFPGPWTSSNSANLLLESFATWGENGNFGVGFDVGEMWTTRNFTGTTIGIAFVPGICNQSNYHCLSENWGGSSEEVRCMTSHELGHNFNAQHDGPGSPFIMAPAVSTATNWSAQSQTSINAYMQTKINNGCLSPCSAAPPLVSAFDWSPEPGCVGQPVQFTDVSTGTITSRSWTFVGGSPSTSTQQNPLIVFNTPGPHNVTLVVNGPGGATANSSQVVTIDALPTANFTFTVEDQTVTFTNNSTNATSYLWQFGDGQESTDFEPVYTYSEAGTYIVTLTAISHCGSITKTFSVNTAPTPQFSAQPTAGCTPLLVQMVNESSSNAVTYQWQFPGGVPSMSSQPSPFVTYNTAGSYSITLVATNNSGTNTITKTNYINVQTLPSSNFTSVANGLTVTFTNTSNNATTYEWNFGDGNTSTLTNPVHTYGVSGTYTVTLTSTNSCGDVSNIKTVILAPPPVASFTTSGNTGCAPLTVNFTNTSTGATTYIWSLPGGSPATSTAAEPTVIFATAGTYSVTLTASNLAGSSTATATVIVNTVPAASFSSTNNGAAVAFTNSSNNASSYSWNFGDNSSSTENNPVHTYAADGVYTVTLTATNVCGSITTTQTITVVTPPIAGFNATPTTGCAPLTVQFSNASSANATAYSWTFVGGNPASSTAANPTVVYTMPGTYSVVLVASNSAGNNTATQTNLVTVNTTPTAGFSSTTNVATVNFTNSSNNATAYSWSFGDGNNSTETSPSHTYATDGTYTVTLTATNVCGSVTTTQTVTIVTPPTAGFNASQTNGCAPFTVQLNNTSSVNAVSFNWQLPGGAPASSTNQNPTVVYNTPGVYTVILTVSNSAGTSTASQIDYITVGTTPSASYTASVLEATATFTNTTTNGVTYSWSFGDGGSSTEANPAHTYVYDGTYSVVLTATNVCGTNTFTQTVVIITEPEAGFTATTTSGCGPLSVQFVDLSSENTSSWLWSFPGGTPNTSTDQNPVVVYLTPGVYDVTLVAAGLGGSSTFTQSSFITVAGAPTGGFTSSVNQNIATFTNSSTNATTYLWQFGDGSSSIEANPSHTYMNDGTYTVILSATNNCGTTIIQQTVTIVTAPVAAFTFNSSVGCLPLAVLFSNSSSSNATSFAWDFQGGSPATSVDQNPVSTWNSAGVYLVTLTASNAAGSSTATATITVNTAPTAGFTAQTAGLSVVTSNTTLNATSYSWTFGDGGVSTEANPTHTYATTGTYTITLVATNACGSTTFTQQVAIVGTAPIASFASNLSAGCAGMTIQFTDQSAGAPTAWLWTFQGGTPNTSTDPNPSVTYATPGTYDVSLEVTNVFGTGSTQLPGYISVLNPPIAGFSFVGAGATVSFTDAAVGSTSSSWNFGDGTSSTELSPSHTYTASGTYTVTQTVSNACGSITLQQTVVVVVVGTNEGVWLNQFRLFPNPNIGRFTVEMSGLPERNVAFDLINSLGQIVHSEIVDFSSGSLIKQFDFGQLPSAVYTLRIQGEGAAIYRKVIVQR